MRTVTFSDERVAERINERFIPAWYNRGPGFHNCNFWTEKNIFTRTADCYPTRNICTFFLTPDRDVMYYVAGYWGPDAFLEILDTVETLQSLPAEKRPAAHARLAASLKSRNVRVAAVSRGSAKSTATAVERLLGSGELHYNDVTHAHDANCLRVLSESFRCRMAVHRQLSKRGPVPLSAVQHKYLFGNSFTEEPDKDAELIPTLAAPRVPIEATPTPGTE